MIRLRIISMFLFAVTASVSHAVPDDLANDVFLRPYVEELKRETPTNALRRIATMTQTDLSQLHHGYGTWIRNKWLWGDRDQALTQFFQTNGISHPDSMSGVLIESLWLDLNKNMSSEEHEAAVVQRQLVARKRQNYDTIEAECESLLTDAQTYFEQCYAAHGLPSKNPLGRDPFFRLHIGKDGNVRSIDFFVGGTDDLVACLRPRIEQFHFSPLTDDDEITLYIVNYPKCRVSDRNRMHDLEQ